MPRGSACSAAIAVTASVIPSVSSSCVARGECGARGFVGDQRGGGRCDRGRIETGRQANIGGDTATDALALVVGDGHGHGRGPTGNRLQQRRTAVRDDETRTPHQLDEFRLRQTAELSQGTRRPLDARADEQSRDPRGGHVGRGRVKARDRVRGARMTRSASRHNEHIAARRDVQTRDQRVAQNRVRRRENHVQETQGRSPQELQLEFFQNSRSARDERGISDPMLIEQLHPAPAKRLASLAATRTDEDDVCAAVPRRAQLRRAARVVEHNDRGPELRDELRHRR